MHSTVANFERLHSHNFYYSMFLQLFHFITIVNILLCPIYKLFYHKHVYMGKYMFRIWENICVYACVHMFYKAKHI